MNNKKNKGRVKSIKLRKTVGRVFGINPVLYRKLQNEAVKQKKTVSSLLSNFIQNALKNIDNLDIPKKTEGFSYLNVTLPKTLDAQLKIVAKKNKQSSSGLVNKILSINLK